MQYDDVARYKQSVVGLETPNDILSNLAPGSFIPLIGDNIDHNINIIDGNKIFHGMGVVAISTPAYGEVICRNCSSAVVKRKKAKSFVINMGIHIKRYFLLNLLYQMKCY